MYKKLFSFFLIFFSFFLISCWWNEDVSNNLNIKIWNYSLILDNDFFVANSNLDSNDIDILYSYRKRWNNNFSDSLIIWEYKWKYPKDEKEFFSIMLDKIKREIAWVSIISNWKVDINWDSLYYIKYKVNDNIFWWDNENIYYWLQAYLFDKNDKIVYIISYLSLEEDAVNDIFDSIKNLEVNK